jgi:hypothetical protein
MSNGNNIFKRIWHAIRNKQECTKEEESTEAQPWWRALSTHQKPITYTQERPFTPFRVNHESFKFRDSSGKAVALDNALSKEMTDATKRAFTFDSCSSGDSFAGSYGGIVPDVLTSWYAQQTFIGWQVCAIVAQHWLVEKACGIKGRDAVRHGYKLSVDDETKLQPGEIQQIEDWDKEFNVKASLIEADKFKNVFGIRHILFLVESDDPEYYTKPFNPDGIKPGKYKGMSQIDPYWMAPQLSGDNVSNPSSQFFYEPEFWSIAGKLYHRTHFVILRGPEVADVLKPTYLYGGIPLTQRIMERVYAAERTANEAPQLAQTKRINVRKMDLEQAAADQTAFETALQRMSEWRDNYGIMAIGSDEDYQQMETTLTDLDVTIMTQYQLVAAIADVPSNKLLETQAKGFNSSGEYETKSYNQTLETIQENDLTKIVDKHHKCLMRSKIMPELKKSSPFSLGIVWNPVDVNSDIEQAEVRERIANADKAYFDMGAIDAMDVRDRLISDDKSGYSGLVPLSDGEEIEIPDAE